MFIEQFVFCGVTHIIMYSLLQTFIFTCVNFLPFISKTFQELTPRTPQLSHSAFLCFFFFLTISGWAVCAYKQKYAKFVLLRLQRACRVLTVSASVFVCSGVLLGIQRMCSCVFVSVDWEYCWKILLWGRPRFEKANESHWQRSYLCMEG